MGIRRKNKKLVYPIYLDTAMLLSLVAMVEDGVSMSREVTETVGSSQNGSLSLEGEGGSAPLLTILGMNVGLEGNAQGDLVREKELQKTYVLQHSFASLFGKLLEYLEANEYVRTNPDVSRLEPGELVCFTATVNENPVDAITDLIRKVQKVAETASPGLFERSRGAKKKANQLSSEEVAQKENIEIAGKMSDLLGQESEESPLTDLLATGEKFQALLTADREYFTAASRASIIGGRFQILGKVSYVERNTDSSVSLGRRTMLAQVLEKSGGMNEIQQGFGEFIGTQDFPSLTIEGPFIQVLPLAIFI
ncbi:hypothetical protein COM45_04275 [Corynebacterium accolens]|uniref:Uncharacterized protein n=1 Tax=Corynebacterium accolens TaxID=38284 RepID=A0A2A4AK36_9CORY|nr:hypothetical protein COM45_04275 [Corynebacterium accolens]